VVAVSQLGALHRFLAAVKTLALVRRLAIPVLQVNLAQQQTNIAGTVASRSTRAEAAETD